MAGIGDATAVKAHRLIKADLFLLAGENDSNLVTILAETDQTSHKGSGNALVLIFWKNGQTKHRLPGMRIAMGTVFLIQRISQDWLGGTAAVDDPKDAALVLCHQKTLRKCGNTAAKGFFGGSFGRGKTGVFYFTDSS
jgi:hypothetical protein